MRIENADFDYLMFDEILKEDSDYFGAYCEGFRINIGDYNDSLIGYYNENHELYIESNGDTHSSFS